MITKLRILLSAIVIGSSISCTSLSLGLPEPHSLKFHKESFQSLASDILNQKEIFEMDDFSRYYKSINNISIRFDKEPVDSFDNSKYFDSVIDSLHINQSTINRLKKQLESTKLREFYKSNDTIVFVVDGFLSDSWGYFYSAKSLKMDSLEFNFGKFNIHYVEDVNEHWKKAAIN